jgi:hypothetical protein
MCKVGMDWSQMDKALTDRARETLELRDRARTFHNALMSPTTLVKFETSFSLYYGVGIILTATADHGRVVRVSMYPNKILAYMGTRDAQGRQTKTSREDHLLSEVVSYIQGGLP